MKIRRCFICNRKVSISAFKADTREDQWVYVGTECRKLITSEGYKMANGPTLYPMSNDRWQYFVSRGMDKL
jgi:hypothetical protein